MAKDVSFNEFVDFFSKLNTENVKSIDEFNDNVKNNISSVAAKLNIGKIAIDYMAPVTVFRMQEVMKYIELYNTGNVGEDCISKSYITGENGSTVFNIYAINGHTFSEEERKSIKSIVYLLYLLYGRSRLVGIYHEAVTRDGLTGALITGEFMKRCSMHKMRGQLPLYNGIFLNIKNFKIINQMVGSTYGDEIMREFVRRINLFMDKDECIGRLGGDNFVLLVQKDKMGSFISFMDNLVCEININGEPRGFKIEVRMGILSIREEDDPSSVMNAISTTINIAKQGRYGDYVWFEDKMIEDEINSKKISLVFSDALISKEFLVYYQPKVSVLDNSLCGCEALVRWNRYGEILPPSEFISTLEKDDNICQLDFYVLERVCEDINDWEKRGIEPLRVSVNFSRKHLYDEDFADIVLTIVRKHGINPQHIEVELTESVSADNYDRMHAFVSVMKENGISVSIDDFGTGYSSLSLLKDLEADVVKVDRSFVAGLNQNNDRIVLKNMISMLRELHKEVLAEGVETLDQASFLTSIGCDIIQGFLYDRPMPKEEFEKRLIDKDNYYR